MAYFNENNTVEQMLINVAEKNGWTYVEAQNIPRAYDDILVGEWLLKALMRLNPITTDQAEQVIYKLRAAVSIGSNSDEMVSANDRFRKLLFEENSYPFGDNGDNINIRFFSDKDKENDYIVTNQWEFPRASKEGGKRLDLVYIINGIPMVIGEAKSPVRPQVTWADGAVDIVHYLLELVDVEHLTGLHLQEADEFLQLFDSSVQTVLVVEVLPVVRGVIPPVEREVSCLGVLHGVERCAVVLSE